MITCILFDLDGVLVGAKEWHYESLNRSLQLNNIPIITRSQHLDKFDGLPTRRKVDMIRNGAFGKLYEISADLETKINDDKQKFTIECIVEYCRPDYTKVEIMQYLRSLGIKIGCCSNSIRKTLETALNKSGLDGFINIILSNQDVSSPKPNPEIYKKAMNILGVTPEETLIVEDNINGKKAAYASGANVWEVIDEKEVKLDNLRMAIAGINYKNLQIVIPMAGKGSRFAKVGYTLPKPLIPVLGVPMIYRVIDNLKSNGISPQWHFICLKEHVEKYAIDKAIKDYCENANIVIQDGNKQGAACSAMLAAPYLNMDNPVLLANSDQLVDMDMREFLSSAIDYDGSVLTFSSSHPKWSYAKVDANNIVLEVKEKHPISDHATVGLYLWNKASYFVDGVNKMITANDTCNGEFYIAPSYNYTILDGKRYTIDEIRQTQMWGLGTPEDLIRYIESHDDKS